jgi:hypothetical protein
MNNPKIRVNLDLPEAFRDENGPLLSLIVATTDLQPKIPDLALHMARHAQAMIKAACSHYKPDKMDDPLQILCDSGNQCRMPYRGKMCIDCPVGQLTSNHEGGHKFIGEQPSPEDEVMGQIFNH